MADPFLAQIIMFGGNFAPRGWALCDGQLLPISQYSALFSLLGTIYGGDGRTTFALPDLRGRVPIHAGNGPGLTPRQLGSRGGGETNTLLVANMPSHDHAATLKVSNQAGEEPTPPANGAIAGGTAIYNEETPNTNMNAASIAVGNQGGGQAFNIIQPFNTVNYIIALQGLFPSRS